MSENEPKEDTESSQLPVDWYYPEELISRYATNIIVQATGQEFILSFFEALPPIVLTQKDLEEIEAVEAECVARIIVSNDRMVEFVNILQMTLQNYLNQKAKQD